MKIDAYTIGENLPPIEIEKKQPHIEHLTQELMHLRSRTEKLTDRASAACHRLGGPYGGTEFTESVISYDPAERSPHLKRMEQEIDALKSTLTQMASALDRLDELI